MLCFLYNRKGKVDWHPATVRCPLPAPGHQLAPAERRPLTADGSAQVLGLIAAVPAVALALVAQQVLQDFEDTLKNLSGYGLFVFALIFIVRGFKARAAAKAPPPTPYATGAEPGPRASAEVGAAEAVDASTEAGKTGFTVPTDDEVQPALGGTPPAPELGCCERLCSWEELIKLGPEGKQVRPRTLGLLSAATVVVGALAGFIGFGNGLLFATMLIVGLEHSTQGGTATACASTSVLMTAVFLVYCHHLRKEILGYIAVGVASSTVGAAAGQAFASKLGSATPLRQRCDRSGSLTSVCGACRPVSVNFFVGLTLMVCAVLAVVPTLLKEDGHGSATPPTDDLLTASLSG